MQSVCCPKGKSLVMAPGPIGCALRPTWRRERSCNPRTAFAAVHGSAPGSTNSRYGADGRNVSFWGWVVPWKCRLVGVKRLQSHGRHRACSWTPGSFWGWVVPWKCRLVGVKRLQSHGRPPRLLLDPQETSTTRLRLRCSTQAPESTYSPRQRRLLRSNFGEQFRSSQKRIRFAVLTMPALQFRCARARRETLSRLEGRPCRNLR